MRNCALRHFYSSLFPCPCLYGQMMWLWTLSQLSFSLQVIISQSLCLCVSQEVSELWLESGGNLSWRCRLAGRATIWWTLTTLTMTLNCRCYVGFQKIKLHFFRLFPPTLGSNILSWWWWWWWWLYDDDERASVGVSYRNDQERPDLEKHPGHLGQ